jgi:hypothetical protein
MCVIAIAHTGVDVFLMRLLFGIACLDSGEVFSERITHGGKRSRADASRKYVCAIALMVVCYVK